MGKLMNNVPSISSLLLAGMVFSGGCSKRSESPLVNVNHSDAKEGLKKECKDKLSALFKANSVNLNQIDRFEDIMVRGKEIQDDFLVALGGLVSDNKGIDESLSFVDYMGNQMNIKDVKKILGNDDEQVKQAVQAALLNCANQYVAGLLQYIDPNVNQQSLVNYNSLLRNNISHISVFKVAESDTTSSMPKLKLKFRRNNKNHSQGFASKRGSMTLLHELFEEKNIKNILGGDTISERGALKDSTYDNIVLSSTYKAVQPTEVPFNVEGGKFSGWTCGKGIKFVVDKEHTKIVSGLVKQGMETVVQGFKESGESVLFRDLVMQIFSNSGKLGGDNFGLISFDSQSEVNKHRHERGIYYNKPAFSKWYSAVSDSNNDNFVNHLITLWNEHKLEEVIPIGNFLALTKEGLESTVQLNATKGVNKNTLVNWQGEEISCSDLRDRFIGQCNETKDLGNRLNLIKEYESITTLDNPGGNTTNVHALVLDKITSGFGAKDVKNLELTTLGVQLKQDLGKWIKLVLGDCLDVVEIDMNKVKVGESDNVFGIYDRCSKVYQEIYDNLDILTDSSCLCTNYDTMDWKLIALDKVDNFKASLVSIVEDYHSKLDESN